MSTPPVKNPVNGRKPSDGPAKRVSMREIAQQAGVSIATVSMVLNDNPKITEATRKKVLAVVNRVGYKPNRIAQSLSGKYTRVLGVLLPTLRHALADPYFGELISGICDRAARLGHKVTLESAKPDFIRERRHVELLERRFVDGVLCLGFNDRHGFLRDFAELNHPMMVVNTEFPQWGLNHVVCDYVSGARQVMTYLLQLGHERIAMVHGSEDIATTRRVQEVFLDATSRAGLPTDATWMADGRFTEEHGAQAARRLLAAHPDLTAIFAGNDKMALGVMSHLAEAGRRVPQDVSVVGCDDIPYAAFLTPKLSTVHTPLYEVGALACERLVEQIRGRTEPVAEVLPTHLVLRDSTSRPPTG